VRGSPYEQALDERLSKGSSAKPTGEINRTHCRDGSSKTAFITKLLALPWPYGRGHNRRS